MQSKGAITFLAVIIALACIWQLSFTAATKIQEGKANRYASAAVEAERVSPSFANVPEVDKAYYLDSIRKAKNSFYLDSVSAEKVYLWYTYKEVKEREINLGLDLKGGMNVMLQVQLKDLVKALSGNSQDPRFLEALDLAEKRSVDSRLDFITLFSQAWDEVAPGERLSQVFGTYDMRDKITPETSNEEVIRVISEEAESAVSNSFNVLRNRIDRFGVTQPNIQKLGNSGRILVELPGVKEPERVRKLLQGTASLEFWTTYENAEIFPYMQEANAMLAELAVEDTTAASAAADTTVASDTDTLLNKVASQNLDMEAYAKENPLFGVLQPAMYNGSLMEGACIGLAHYRDTAKVNQYLHRPEIQALFPADFIPMWSVKPSGFMADGNYYELVAIKASSRDGKAPLDGGAVTDARVSYSNVNGSPEVDMVMNGEGARTWARLTADNIGHQIAIVLDGMVYSYPRVNSEITGGRSAITGNFTVTEAEDLANVLKSGKLPAPATIVQEQVVGPSLGSESINAGLISFIIAFLLVLLYMLFFYNGAGLAADIALLCNVLFLFGALASFGAVLTLPGIAGLVLTLGMAVDANVIIYERIKEEIRAGKGLALAVKEGYRNAYSAIIDGQVTTIITGIVLIVFGSGPVQGFATTLIIGIITSLLTSIFISRLIFEARLAKKKNITFDNKWTRNFLHNTKVNFLSKRKYSYTISGIVILICLGSIIFKGFTYGVDFTGGRTFVVRFDQPVSAEDIREATTAEFGGSVEVKQVGGEGQMKSTPKYMIEDQPTDIDAQVEQMLYDALHPFFAEDITFDEFKSTLENPNGIISSDKVGPTIANDMKRDAIIAVVVALLAIFVYIAVRFRNWTWGAGGVLSLTHTTIITVGFFSLFTGVFPFSLDVDQSFIAAVLTIIGYAINDTVVIFDRIREYRRLYPKRPLQDNVNNALNSTLTRTMNTSLTTIIVMVAIAIFGGEVIRGLSVALVVGISVGTYASMFIGTPIMYDLSRRKINKELAKENK